MPSLYKLTIEKGPEDAVAQLAGGATTVIKKGFAEDKKLKVGDPLTLRTPERTTVSVRVGAIVKDEGGLVADVTLPTATVEREFGETQGRDRPRRGRRRRGREAGPGPHRGAAEGAVPRGRGADRRRS